MKAAVLIFASFFSVSSFSANQEDRSKQLKFDDDLVEGLSRNLYDSLRTTNDDLASMPDQIERFKNPNQDITDKLILFELRRSP